MKVKVYVEGGGDQSRTATECRRGFSEFFRKLLPAGKNPQIIACGSRNDTFDRFKTSLKNYSGEFIILLVDAEAPVADGVEPWAHLKARDNWDRPAAATDDHAHLMVQCMEAWFLADRRTLALFYGEGFSENALPRRADVEKTPKAQIEKGLKQATRHTKTKGEYHKTRHGFDLLAEIDARAVCGAAPHADRLRVVLERELAR